MIKSLKKVLREHYIKDPQGFWNSFRNSLVVTTVLLGIILLAFVSGCERRVKVYEVRTADITYQTSESDKRIKEPVQKETVYLVVED